MSEIEDINTPKTPGWTSDSELVREFARPVAVADAVVSTVYEAINKWPDLSNTPPLYDFVDVERLDGLFRSKAVDSSRWAPSVEFRFQSCQVTVLYGREIRVIVQRDK